MTVKELINKLRVFDGNDRVFMFSDEEGNEVRPLYFACCEPEKKVVYLVPSHEHVKEEK